MKHMHINDVYSHDVFRLQQSVTEQRLTFKSEKSVTYLAMQLLIVLSKNLVMSSLYECCFSTDLFLCLFLQTTGCFF